MENLKIKVILGSTRQGRFGDKAAQWIYEIAKQRTGFDVELLDLRDYAMPLFDEAVTPSQIKEPYANEAVARWTKKIAEADAFIVATPEYNHAPSAALKNAFDYVSKEWAKKPVAYVAWGSVGGARSVEVLRLMAVELQMAPIKAAVYIIAPWMLLDKQGGLPPGALDPMKGAADGMLDQLAWWGNMLKTARAAQ